MKDQGRMPVKVDPSWAKAVGARIIQARKEAGGMTQQELSELVGVTVRSVAAWESGETGPWRYIPKIAEATGASGAWLLHGEEQPHPDGSGELAEMKALLETVLKELRSLKRSLAK